MTDEITTTVFLRLQKGNIDKARNVSNFLITQSGDGFNHDARTITTTPAALDIGGITTTGVAFFRNLDSTNFVEVGITSGTFQPFLKLEPGEAQLFRLATNTPFAKADTASVELEYWINEA